MLLNAFFVFHYKICIFIIFISFFLSSFFFDEVSNFRNRILTSQKRELVVFNCQLNCIPGRFPKEHKISIFKAMTSEKLTCRTDKSIYSFLLLNQLSRPSVMLRHILNYQHMHVRLVRTSESVLTSVQHDFMNFIQIGRYKTNANAGCHFRHFLSSMLINYQIKN